jgi:hypothetical protein
VQVLNPTMQIGDVIVTNGIVRTNPLPRVGVQTFSYTSSFTAQNMNIVTVPAGTFDALRLQGTVNIAGQAPAVFNLDLAEGIGAVRQIVNFLNVSETFELVEYKVGIHDLAIARIIAPATVTLTAKNPAQTKQVKVELQNRSPHSEAIDDEVMLSSLVSLTVHSMGTTCPNIAPVLHVGRPQKPLPLTLKPKQKLTVLFDVTFDCANDAAKSTPKDPGHRDFRYVAVVNHAALDGESDVHPYDDVCPRDIELPGVDPYPNGTIKDRGCGGKRSDGTLGADVTTDVVLK